MTETTMGDRLLMKKHLVKAAVLLVIAGILFIFIFSLQKGKEKEGLKAAQKTQSDTDEMYQKLNHGLLGTNHIKWASRLIEEGACSMSEEVKGEFVPAAANGFGFPKELVMRLEEAFYYSCNTKSRGEESAYDKTVAELGGDEFRMRPEDIYRSFPQIAACKEQIESEEDAYALMQEQMGGPPDCLKMFYIPEGGEPERYIFVYRSGGSDGVVSVMQAQLQDNRFVSIGEFETQNEGEGTVIRYDGEFYYVFLQYNYNLKYYDGIRLHKLGSDPETENLLIRYLPEQFVWKNIYSSAGGELDEYLEAVKEDFTKGNYLDDGQNSEVPGIYYGDETETSDFCQQAQDTLYKTDLANCKIPVYLCKNLYTPSDIKSRCHLKIQFFLYDSEKDSVAELEKLSINDDGGWLNLVQMWFQEIGGKVYTFCVYHITDYNYMLDVVLLEEDRITHVRTVLLLPERKFVLMENDSFLGGKAEATSPDCFTYEELPDGTLRITGYDEEKNTQNPYQVTVPSVIDGKRVSTLGKECLGKPYADHLLELTVSDGITTLEENVIESAYDISLIKLPNSVVSIDEKTFWRNDNPWPVVIACKDTAYAYQYAQENHYACQVIEPSLPENDFLDDYREGIVTALPYYAYLRREGQKYNYITIEFRENEMEKRLAGELVYHDPNEFLVLVLDKKSGHILQCLDSTCLDAEKVGFYRLEGVDCRNFLSLADWNFDGEEDICCYQGVFGTGAASFSSLFVYDSKSGLFENIPEFTGIDSPSLRPDKQCIYGFSRDGAASHYVDRFEYVEGAFMHVARLSMLGSGADEVEIIDERLSDGEWQIYCQETFFSGELSGGEESEQDAYEQAKVLYVGDGYWDLW